MNELNKLMLMPITLQAKAFYLYLQTQSTDLTVNDLSQRAIEQALNISHPRLVHVVNELVKVDLITSYKPTGRAKSVYTLQPQNIK